jgi:DNA-directed RNA polymerase specialized sigma24 family protein
MSDCQMVPTLPNDSSSSRTADGWGNGHEPMTDDRRGETPDIHAGELRRRFERERQSATVDLLTLVARSHNARLVRQAGSHLTAAGLSRHAEDIVQEALIFVLTTDKFSPNYEVEQVMKFLRNKIEWLCKDLLRRKRPELGLELDIDDPQELGVEDVTTSEALADDFLRDVLDRVHLTPRERDTFERIMAATGVPLRTLAAQAAEDPNSKAEVDRRAASLRKAKQAAAERFISALQWSKHEEAVFRIVYTKGLTDRDGATELGITADEFTRLYFSAIDKLHNLFYNDGGSTTP